MMPRVFTCILLLAVVPGAVSAQVAVRGGKVYTMTVSYTHLTLPTKA